MEEGCINLTLKGQLTAAKRGTVLKFDGNEVIGSERCWQDLIGLTERVNALSQLIELEEGRRRERDRE